MEEEQQEPKRRGRPPKAIPIFQTQEDTDDTSKKIDKLLEVIEQERQARIAAEAKLQEKELVEKKEKDPMSGPGVLCECTKITLSEAWQLKSQERLNPITGVEEMVTDPAPPGYDKRLGPNNGYFVVKPENNRAEIRLEQAVIPNCQSKYTREYYVYTKKPVEDRGDFKKEPPKVKVNLCEKHQQVFGAKTKEQWEAEGKSVPN